MEAMILEQNTEIKQQYQHIFGEALIENVLVKLAKRGNIDMK